MKFILTVLSTLTVFASATIVRAEVDNSQFTCTYKPGNQSDEPTETLIFKAEGVDLSNPNVGGPFESETISLYVNGSSVPSMFDMKKSITRFSEEIVYSQRGQAYINDIVIRYYKDANGSNSFKGTWTVDYPPVIELNCTFDPKPKFRSLGYKRYILVDGVCYDDKAGVDVALSYCKKN